MGELTLLLLGFTLGLDAPTKFDEEFFLDTLLDASDVN